jgi:hypothetical protein
LFQLERYFQRLKNPKVRVSTNFVGMEGCKADYSVLNGQACFGAVFVM